METKLELIKELAQGLYDSDAADIQKIMELIKGNMDMLGITSTSPITQTVHSAILNENKEIAYIDRGMRQLTIAWTGEEFAMGTLATIIKEAKE